MHSRSSISYILLYPSVCSWCYASLQARLRHQHGQWTCGCWGRRGWGWGGGQGEHGRGCGARGAGQLMRRKRRICLSTPSSVGQNFGSVSEIATRAYSSSFLSIPVDCISITFYCVLVLVSLFKHLFDHLWAMVHMSASSLENPMQIDFFDDLIRSTQSRLIDVHMAL